MDTLIFVELYFLLGVAFFTILSVQPREIEEVLSVLLFFAAVIAIIAAGIFNHYQDKHPFWSAIALPIGRTTLIFILILLILDYFVEWASTVLVVIRGISVYTPQSSTLYGNPTPSQFLSWVFLRTFVIALLSLVTALLFSRSVEDGKALTSIRSNIMSLNKVQAILSDSSQDAIILINRYVFTFSLIALLITGVIYLVAGLIDTRRTYRINHPR